MPTIRDIAKEAGVAQGTVSNVLNGRGNVSSDKIILVEQACAKLGYTMNQRAKTLRQGSSKLLAAIIPNVHDRRYTDFSLNTLNFFPLFSFLPTIKSLISCRTIYHIFNMEVATNNWFTKKYPIGFALSGGFIKGFAHLGAMQSLLEHDIKPNILSGVSAGALAGVFYADGNEPHQVLDYFAGHKFQDLTKLVIPKVGLFELGEFIDFLKSNLKSKKLEELQIPLIITATDLDHGRLVHFHKGDIAERVAASCCMPVLFAPVNIDGTHYVDGGLLMNLPVSTLRRICEKVIAVNVSPLMATKYKMNIVSIALRSYNFMFRSNSFPEREKADLLIEPYNLEGYSNTELEKAEEIFMQGYNTTNDILERLLIDKGSIWKE